MSSLVFLFCWCVLGDDVAAVGIHTASHVEFLLVGWIRIEKTDFVFDWLSVVFALEVCWIVLGPQLFSPQPWWWKHFHVSMPPPRPWWWRSLFRREEQVFFQSLGRNNWLPSLGRTAAESRYRVSKPKPTCEFTSHKI